MTLKRFFAAIIAISVLVALVGCGDKEPTTPTTVITEHPWFITVHIDSFSFSIEGKGIQAFSGDTLVIGEPGDTVVVCGGRYDWTPEGNPSVAIQSDSSWSLNSLLYDNNLKFDGTLVLNKDGNFYWACYWNCTESPHGIVDEDKQHLVFTSLAEPPNQEEYQWYIAARNENDSLYFKLSGKGIESFDGYGGLLTGESGDTVVVCGGVYDWTPEGNPAVAIQSDSSWSFTELQYDLNLKFDGTLVLMKNGNTYWTCYWNCTTDPSGIVDPESQRLVFSRDQLP